ncbi:MAG: metallophosphoesterase, partial [Candidatus Micrarchaeota archaeon]
MFDDLAASGIRLTVEAEGILRENRSAELLDRIKLLKKPLVSKEDLEAILMPPEPAAAEVSRPSSFAPPAKDYSPDIKVNHTLDVTGKSRTKGEVDNFIAHFRNRYERIARMLRRSNSVPTIELADARRHVGEKARIIVFVSEKKETKKGNLLFEVEDLSGTFKAIVSQSGYNEKAMEKAKMVLTDDVVAITGKVLEPYIIVEDIEWPDLPVVREKKRAEVDVAIAYLSDLHFGSRYFLGKYLDSFKAWLHGEGEMRDLAGRVKYICIAGDIADGIGVYPNQEKELVVKDIYAQYKMFDDFVASLPDYLEIIVAPGNHDAVRRGEPQPALGKDLIQADVISVGNPSSVAIEGIK